MSARVNRVLAGAPKGGEFATTVHTEFSGELNARTLLAGSPAPEVHIGGLTHIGNLNAADKHNRSHEGQGLSVSRDPDAWQKIARLSGDTWSIGPAEPARFLNYHELTPDQREAIADYGVQAGYVTREIVYRVSYWDEEAEDKVSFLERDRAAADYEAEDIEGSEIDEIPALMATEQFKDSTVRYGDIGVDQILATVWVNEAALEFDGVWWDDNLDVDKLSAPRGVIVPRAIERWVATARHYNGGTD